MLETLDGFFCFVFVFALKFATLVKSHEPLPLNSFLQENLEGLLVKKIAKNKFRQAYIKLHLAL